MGGGTSRSLGGKRYLVVLCVCLVKLAINTFVFHVITVYPNVSLSA